MEILLNSRTSTLCFNKDDFISKDFTVDKFVSNYRKYVSLEAMLEDLGLYHKILCSAMVELINKDYADFVNFSSNLVGLDKSIKNLSFPLQKLRTEVEDQKGNIDETLSNIKFMFIGCSSAYKQKVLANYFLCLVEGLKKFEVLNLSLASDKMLPTENLERIALDLNLLQFHMSKICFKNMDDKKGILLEVTENLKERLEYLLLRNLSENDVPSLCRILRIYSVNNNEREVEAYFCQTVVKPYMRKHLTEENLLKYGLPTMYNKILSFIPTFCASVLDATRGTKRYADVVTGYDFLVNAVFPEIVHCFGLITPVHLYAPGDPKLFHHNFTATIFFLGQFEHHCEVQPSVQKLRKHSSYTSFLSKWNLDLYFQICFQEIAGNFENSLLTNFKHNTQGKDVKYLLNVSRSLLQSIELCWNDKIFLHHLSSRFYRLTLQLISRFCKWLHMSLSLECSKDQGSLSAIQVAMVIKDMELLICDLKYIFDNEISSKVSRSLIESSFQESVTILENIVPLASTLLIKLLLSHCVSHLKLITDIPRLYRKTNRTVPSKASGYVSLVFRVLIDFLSATESFISVELKQLCLKEVIDGIITEFFVMTQDVLTSIKKMEDSLKILKRAHRDKPSGQTLSGSISDDDKIRRQLAIDLESIEEKVKKMGLQVESLKSFKELKQLIILAEKHIA